eukprot:CAMPEP_0177757530 /NCGR_PEP_ID=MMETSP0491_2-20121128/3691_1 /TAXON_ID=63592 /ORGANISM="Tetraselmis chuii, Strain PLY429" /LENGTH=129 /DNA_ID=CAMNT_0019273185 /DNA_START=1211 /DNA_END=1597 /DNA_ORIENTATION=-
MRLDFIDLAPSLPLSLPTSSRPTLSGKTPHFRSRCANAVSAIDVASSRAEQTASALYRIQLCISPAPRREPQGQPVEPSAEAHTAPAPKFQRAEDAVDKGPYFTDGQLPSSVKKTQILVLADVATAAGA